MRRKLGGFLAAVLLGFAAGCGGEKPVAPENTEADSALVSPTPASPAEELPAEESATGDPAPEAPESTPNAPDPAAEASDDLHRKLIGTVWNVGGVEFSFLDHDTLFLKGGPLQVHAPRGYEEEYRYDNGSFETRVLGHTKTGTWDGTQLVVDGTQAVMQ